MSDYNRMISYVYVYNKEEKGKNVGFVKLESRNGQCKIGISLKGIHTGNADLDVFLFAYQKKVRVGKIYIRNGQGELRIVTEQENLVGSGESLSSMGGLRIDNQEPQDIYYATIWDDELIASDRGNIRSLHVAQLELEKRVETAEIEPDIETKEAAPPVSAKVEFVEMKTLENEITPQSGLEMNKNSVREVVQETNPESAKTGTELEAEAETAAQLQAESNLSAESVPQIQPEMSQSVWDHLTKKFPKTQCFASDKPHEILAIQPQDIGILPRDAWIFGNNSFLLHGYYQYRYLILVKMKIDEERDKYLLGVPGIYHNNERFMATMFGFSNFYLAKRQSPKMGQFGYWCTEIKLV